MQLSTRQALLAYTVLALALSTVVVLVDSFSPFLIALMAPVLAAAVVMRRPLYWAMLAIALPFALVTVVLVSKSLGDSLVTLFGLALATLLASEILHRETLARAQAERRSAALITLGQRLNTALTTLEAAQVIVEVADELLGWDACIFELYHAERDQTETILLIDTVDGERRNFVSETPNREPTLIMRRTLVEGGQLILRSSASETSGLVRFGDKARPSASLMYVPLQTGTTRLGILSIQSYRQNAYHPADLETLQALADYCGGGLERLRADKRATEALLRHHKLESLGALAGGLAHDFNNLLTIIVGNAELALGDLPDKHPVVDALDQIRGAAERAADLTHQMLAYAGRGSMVLETVSLNPLVEENLMLAATSLPGDVRLRKFLAPALPPVGADRAQLSKLILNLIINAIEAIADRQGTITIKTCLYDVRPAELYDWSHPGELQPGRHVCLEISDDGPGMDDTTQARIFDPFFSTKFIGRGLGLPVVLGIVRSHAGALNVRSAPERGTTITLLLPLLTQVEHP